MSRSRSALATLATVATAVSGAALLAPQASANTPGPGLVINEVYGGGGNSGATLTNDFVELKNTGSATVSLGGMRLEYRSATGTGDAGSGITPLPDVDLPPGESFLVQEAKGAGGTQSLPAPDATGTIAMGSSGGQVYLVKASATDPFDPGTGNIDNPDVVDFVGWGSTTTSYETAHGPASSNTTSVARNAAGDDTNNNSADFTAGAPTPSACGTDCPSTPPPPPTEHTIAEIQGTGASSPLTGDRVITQGVVTAAYPDGGFSGFVIQTDGTGSGTDQTDGASDGIFVFQSGGPVTVQVGDYVQVTGDVSEYRGLTELDVDAADVRELDATPVGITPLAIAYPDTAAGREAHESELLAPTGRFTVTDNYDTNQYGEIGLATGDHQLWQPTGLYNPNIDPAGVASVEAENFGRGVVLDDGSSWNYLTTYKNTAMPWLTKENPVRIGSAATLQAPVILDYRNNLWKFQPTHQVTDAGTDVATFSDTRAANQAPQHVGGDIKLGTFNVLNYFNTTGEDWVARGHTCSFYYDRTGDPVGDKECSDNGPRGAAQSSGGADLAASTADFERQQAKEVRAINTMDADILSLEEIENSVVLGEDRDDALASLVDALNADAGTTRWAYAPSPEGQGALPPLDQQDVIRTAFIYNPDTVELVGASKVLSDESGPGEPFENAREPLAQEFKRKGALDRDGFLVVVNHFKSKGSGVDDGTGQGLSNPDRVAQAHALVDFANATAQADGTKRIFLVGDFNSYTQEDPMQVLYQKGFVNQPSDDDADTSYEFDGMAGSLDHVLANTAAANLITGRDVWQINAEESVGFEYSRYNYNATLLYQDNQFRASDHNPELVGLSVPFTRQDSTVTATATPDTVKRKKTESRIDVTVSGDQGVTPTGVVEFWVNGVKVGTATLDDGQASLSVGPFQNAGVQHVEVRYLGDDLTAPGTATTTVTVVNGNP